MSRMLHATPRIVLGCLASLLGAGLAHGQSTERRSAGLAAEQTSGIVAWVTKGGGATTRVSIFVYDSEFFQAKSKFSECLLGQRIEATDDYALEAGSSCGLRIPVPKRLTVSNKQDNSSERRPSLNLEWKYDFARRGVKVEGRPIESSSWNLRLLECFCDLSKDATLVRFYSGDSPVDRKICEHGRDRLRSEVEEWLEKHEPGLLLGIHTLSGDNR